MTKLEKKLQELGYKSDTIYLKRYIKYYKETDNYILVQLSNDRETIKNCYTYCQSAFTKQKHIKKLQETFDEMQKDLEVLKEYESA